MNTPYNRLSHMDRLNVAGWGTGSQSAAKHHTTTLPMSSIHTVTTKGSKVSWARRNIKVPKAQQNAAPIIQATPCGRPAKLLSSSHKSRAMAKLAQTTASKTRRFKRSW